MAINVLPASEAAQKWSTRASGASATYAARARAAGTNWEQAAANAQQTYVQAVTQGNIGQRFASGVRRAGSARYTEGIAEKGESRYGQGVQASQSRYIQGVEPYLNTIASVTLPQRAPRGNPSNYQRVQAVGQALHQRKLAMQGAAAGR